MSILLLRTGCAIPIPLLYPDTGAAAGGGGEPTGENAPDATPPPAPCSPRKRGGVSHAAPSSSQSAVFPAQAGDPNLIPFPKAFRVLFIFFMIFFRNFAQIHDFILIRIKKRISISHMFRLPLRSKGKKYAAFNQLIPIIYC
jgi:hypothetical protein